MTILLVILLSGIIAVGVVAEEIIALQDDNEAQITENTVTALVITSPTTQLPVTVTPGGTVDITIAVTVNHSTQDIRRQIEILNAAGVVVTTVNETLPNPSAGWAVNVPITMSRSVTAPSLAGTYQIRVRARQPATGGQPADWWQQEAIMSAAVIVSAPLPPPPPADTTAPVLLLPAPITAEATGPGGAVVDFGVSVHDAVDGTVAATATPASGFLFPLGPTTVHVSASDAAGNTATGTFTVTVVDTTRPTITAPAAISVEGNATGGVTGVALGTPTVSDIVDPAPTVTNNAPALFPLGQTTVTWTATDASGNYATATQVVTVVDTTRPTITAVGSLTVIVGSPSSALPSPTVVDLVDPSPTVTNNAPAFFPPGNTLVTWTATDASDNFATATTTVTAHYAFGGIRQPINSNGSSIFRLGSTVPVKFQLRDANGNFVTNAVAQIFLARVTGEVFGEEKDAVSTSNATTGNLFRYDSTDNQYIFNWGTRGLSTGTWQIRIVLDDGSIHTVLIGLR